ncbi:hypothetical protein [Rhodococcus sp. NPDC058521]|uniref:hypothetical protein n=1 Tax=Rhodococcus sp. NPDC058521 TaxID=3346536 RepID=UPI00365FEE8C
MVTPSPQQSPKCYWLFASTLMPGWSGTPIGALIADSSGLRTAVDNDLYPLAVMKNGQWVCGPRSTDGNHHQIQP